MRALVVVDVQNDFCPGGALATDRGTQVAEGIAAFTKECGHHYSALVVTKDWHIDPGEHFSETPDFQHSWPVHCVAGTTGAQLEPHLRQLLVSAVFHKGAYEAAYSGFEGRLATDTTHPVAPEGPLLADWLREHDISAIDVCGIATDYCVHATARDGINEGFSVRLIADLCSPVSAESEASALQDLRDRGVEFVRAEEGYLPGE